ncbi:SMP-30/gluconolactonase/LRE family protein [Rhodococcus koreensis]
MPASNREVKVVAEGFSYLEGPRWHHDRLWVSDFYLHEVYAIDGDGRREVMAVVPGQPSGTGWLPDGRLLIVSMKDRRLLALDTDGSLSEYADLSGLSEHKLNDMVVDSHGRAYVGGFGFDLMGGGLLEKGDLFVVDTDGAVSVAAAGLAFPNGAVILNDSTLVLSETMGNCLTGFDIASDGSLTNRRAWAEFGAAPTTRSVPEMMTEVAVAPDGMTADAEGAVWVADAVNNRVVRVREGGEIVDEISTGALGVYACALGGEGGDTLYMCAAPSFVEHERINTKEAQLLSVRVDVPHAGRP